MDQLNPDDVFYNNRLAFKVGSSHLNIPEYLEAEDMVAMRVPDRLCIITYISGMYKELSKMQKKVSNINNSNSIKNPTINELTNKDEKSPKSQANPSPPSPNNNESNYSVCRECSKPVQFLIERSFDNGVMYHRRCLSKKNQKDWEEEVREKRSFEKTYDYIKRIHDPPSQSSTLSMSSTSTAKSINDETKPMNSVAQIKESSPKITPDKLSSSTSVSASSVFSTGSGSGISSQRQFDSRNNENDRKTVKPSNDPDDQRKPLTNKIKFYAGIVNSNKDEKKPNSLESWTKPYSSSKQLIKEDTKTQQTALNIVSRPRERVIQPQEKTEIFQAIEKKSPTNNENFNSKPKPFTLQKSSTQFEEKKENNITVIGKPKSSLPSNENKWKPSTIIGKPLNEKKTSAQDNTSKYPSSPVRPSEILRKKTPLEPTKTETKPSLSKNDFSAKTSTTTTKVQTSLINTYTAPKSIIPMNNTCADCGKIISRPFEEMKDNGQFYHKRCLDKIRKDLASLPANSERKVLSPDKNDPTCQALMKTLASINTEHTDKATSKSLVSNIKKKSIYNEPPPKPPRPKDFPQKKFNQGVCYENNPAKPPRKQSPLDATDNELNKNDKILKDIKHELDMLEMEGRRIEELYRKEENVPNGNPDKILPEFLNIIMKKNELVRLEEDIIYKRRNEELEKEQQMLLDRYYRLQDTLNEGEHTKALRELEERIVKVVEERNRVVQNVEEARKRILEEDEYVQTMLECKFKVKVFIK